MIFHDIGTVDPSAGTGLQGLFVNPGDTGHHVGKVYTAPGDGGEAMIRLFKHYISAAVATLAAAEFLLLLLCAYSPNGASADYARHKLEYDLHNVKNYSPFLDLPIMLQTLRVLLWPAEVR
jgi:hypothetical protein